MGLEKPVLFIGRVPAEQMITMSVHKFLSLAIADYWKNELEVNAPHNQEFIIAEARLFFKVVNEGGVIAFFDFLANKAHSASIQFALSILNDPENMGGLIIDDIPDSTWISIQNQLKADLVGWL